MVKVKVIDNFTLGKFDELKNIVRANPSRDVQGGLFQNDTFECTEDMAEYLTKTNAQGKAFVEVIELIPNKEIQKAIEKTIEEDKKDKEIKPKRKRRTIAKED